MRRVVVALVAVALSGGFLTGCDADHKTASAKKDRLPEIHLASLGGGPGVDLAELKGPAVINLWASWCKPCKRELPIYADFARAYAGRVDVLGVDFQETSSSGALDLMKKSDVDYPVVTDPDGDLRAIGLPKLILLGADGRITYQEYVEIKSTGQLEDLVAKHLGVKR